MAEERFARAVARTAVAQVLESARFQAARGSATDALAEVLTRYVQEVAALSRDAAAQAGRADAALPDVLAALAELGTTAPSLVKFVREDAEEVPFARALPRFPLRKRPKLSPSFAALGETPPAHVPAFLPALPDKHTYQRTPVYADRAVDVPAQREALAKDQRKAEQALITLHEKVSPLGGTDEGASANGDSGRAAWGELSLLDVAREQRQALALASDAQRDAVAQNAFFQLPPAAAATAEAAGSRKHDRGAVTKAADSFEPLFAAAAKCAEKVKSGTAWNGWGDTEATAVGEAAVVPRESPLLTFSLDYAARTRAAAKCARGTAPKGAPAPLIEADQRTADAELENERVKRQRTVDHIIQSANAR